MLHTFILTNCQNVSFLHRSVRKERWCCQSPCESCCLSHYLWFSANVIIFQRHLMLTRGCSVALGQSHIDNLSHLWHFSCSKPPASSTGRKSVLRRTSDVISDLTYYFRCICICVVPASAIWTCVIKCMKLWSNEISMGVYKRENGPTRPDGNKSSSGTREEVTGQTQAK